MSMSLGFVWRGVEGKMKTSARYHIFLFLVHKASVATNEVKFQVKVIEIIVRKGLPGVCSSDVCHCKWWRWSPFRIVTSSFVWEALVSKICSMSSKFDKIAISKISKIAISKISKIAISKIATSKIATGAHPSPCVHPPYTPTCRAPMKNLGRCCNCSTIPHSHDQRAHFFAPPSLCH